MRRAGDRCSLVRYSRKMDVVACIISFSWIFAGLLSAALALPLALGRISRNRLYGFRIRESLASDDAWTAINRFAGRRFAIWSLAMIGWGAAVCFMQLKGNEALAVCLAFAPLWFLIVPCVQAWRFAKRSTP